MCSQAPSQWDCDFEEGNLCLWREDTSSAFVGQWFIQTGPTPTNLTGPPADHTMKNFMGHYIYTEADGHKSGDKSR